MSKGPWTILVMAFVAVTLMIVGMMMSLMQFQKVPAVKMVKLAEQIGREFKLENVGADIKTSAGPSILRITYLTRVDTKFDSSVQNQEMKRIAEFAIKNYDGNDRHLLGEIQVSRSETHGSGCFQTTYVANCTVPNPYQGRRPGTPPGPGASPIIPLPEK